METWPNCEDPPGRSRRLVVSCGFIPFHPQSWEASRTGRRERRPPGRDRARDAERAPEPPLHRRSDENRTPLRRLCRRACKRRGPSACVPERPPLASLVRQVCHAALAGSRVGRWVNVPHARRVWTSQAGVVNNANACRTADGDIGPSVRSADRSGTHGRLREQDGAPFRRQRSRLPASGASPDHLRGYGEGALSAYCNTCARGPITAAEDRRARDRAVSPDPAASPPDSWYARQESGEPRRTA